MAQQRPFGKFFDEFTERLTLGFSAAASRTM